MKVTRTWKINGEAHVAEFAPMRRLLDVLREDLGLFGTKEGCGEGECGACTVLVNGRPLVSCLIAAGQIPEDSEILTVEGLESTIVGKTLQDAYIQKGAAQCGFCIPGMLISSYALLAAKPSANREEIREALAGNICRCTGYHKIVEAVESAADILSE